MDVIELAEPRLPSPILFMYEKYNNLRFYVDYRKIESGANLQLISNSRLERMYLFSW